MARSMASSTIVFCALGLVLLDMQLCARLDASYLSTDLHNLIKEDAQMKMPGGRSYYTVVHIFDNFADGWKKDYDGCPADWKKIDSMEICMKEAKDKIEKGIWGEEHLQMPGTGDAFEVTKEFAWWPSGCIVNKGTKRLFFNPYDAKGRKTAKVGKLKKTKAIQWKAICTKDVALPENWRAAKDAVSGNEYYWNVVTKETSWDPPAVNASGMESAICCVNPERLPEFRDGQSFREFAGDRTAFHSNPAETCKSVKREIMPTQCCTSFPANTIDFLSLREAGISEKDDIVWQKTPTEFWGCYCRILTKCLYREGERGLRLKHSARDLEASRLVCDALVAYEAFPANLASEEHVRKYYTEAYKDMIKSGYIYTSPVDFCAA